ncbi:WD40-repeat-containing domain [Pseudocohnilembus persalinus]|uniref:WD40-repeat-containing domain n=1 Tax=Pseudocohnilembus persalinus TaxID=266149 RepID=A0A0V0Q987_PSEPJ|nr:WD40-repeat-containing domain [Pseudocohnilembus persalinus]|eukprot:KRW98793.1 WD40-repeat-containing domain [Pseudocohnilembus persalinus]
MSQISQNPQKQTQNQQQQNQTQQIQQNSAEIYCSLHPCRTKYFCVEKTCAADFRAACGECFTEGPHQGHKIIQIAEYESSLKTNYQKLQSQIGSIDNTQTLVEKVNKLFTNLKQKLDSTLDQAKQHVLREIFSQQDKKETEKFKLMNLRIKQLKKCFFYGGAAKFPKNIGDFSLDLYNMDQELLDYLNQLKEERDNYIKPFETNYNQISQKIDELIKNEIADLYKISPIYPMKFDKEIFQGKMQPIEGHQNKINIGVKFIHNQTSHKKQQLDPNQQLTEIQNFIFTCAKDNSLRLWNLGCGKANNEEFKPSLWKTYMFENKEITALCQLDYNHLVTGNTDGYIQVWDIRDASCKAKFSHLDENNKNFKPQHGQVPDFDQDEQQEEVQESVLLRNAERSCQLKKITYLLQINEQIVVAGYADGDIRVWDVNQGKIQDLFNFYETSYDNKVQQEQLAIHKIVKYNQWVLISTGSKIIQNEQNANNNNISQSHLETSQKADLENSLINSSQPAQKGKQNPKNKEKNVVIVWNWLNQDLIAEYAQHKEKIIDIINISQIIISASKDNEIHIWDLNNANTLKIIENSHKGIKAITQLSDQIFSSCGDDLIVKLWEIQPDNFQENKEQLEVKNIQEIDDLAPKNENEVQLLKQKPNSLTYLQRLSETEIVVGSLQPPYLQLIN